MQKSKRLLAVMLLASILTMTACASSDAVNTDTSAVSNDTIIENTTEAEYNNPGINYDGAECTILE